jgi:lysophospholipase L1-like esterase
MRISKKTSTAGFIILILSICCVCETAFAEEHWVGTWACSQQLVESGSNPPSPYLAGNTLRQIAHTSLGGGRIRVQFSNKYSSSAITINGAHVAIPKGAPAIDTTTDKALTFGGSASVTINAGQEVFSDALDFNVKPLSDLAVSIWFGTASSTNVTGHTLSQATSWVKIGNALSSGNFAYGGGTTHWYILSGVDVWRDDSHACVVTLGDSITDGAYSAVNGNNRWPDDFARRLHADPSTAKVGVLNHGISGNMVVAGGTGPSAIMRFDHDVLAQSGIRWLIILEGVNDIGGSSDPPTTANNLIAAYQQLVDKAHAQNIPVYGATITPFKGSGYGTPAKLAARNTVNEWIRTSGKFDAVIDMDAAVRDPNDPDKLLAAYVGDYLHPNAAGLQAMADAIDINLFKLNEADLNRNGIVDSVDFAILAGQWQQAPGLPSADITPPVGDGTVDFTDFYSMAQEWLDVNLFQQEAADLNNDGVVDFADFAVLAGQWQASGSPSADIAPPVGDGTVDFTDFYSMAQEWLTIW